MEQEEFDRIAKEKGVTIAAVYALEEEPKTGSIVSPSGRVFIEIEPWVIQRTMLLMEESVGRGESILKPSLKTVGTATVLKELMAVHEFISVRAGIERAEREANQGLDNNQDS